MLPCLAWVVGAVLALIGRNMESYYDSLIQELLGGGMAKDKQTYYRSRPIVGAGLPQGMSEEDLASGMLGGGFDERTARRFASGAEDVMLSGHLGSKREKGKNENLPSGSFAQAIYPMLYNAIDKMNMPGGSNPQGYFGYMSKEQQDEADRRNQEWAAIQRSMIPQGNFVSRMGGR